MVSRYNSVAKSNSAVTVISAVSYIGGMTEPVITTTHLDRWTLGSSQFSRSSHSDHSTTEADMLPLASEYAWRSRDAKWERELALKLRATCEDDRLTFIQEFTTANTIVGLELAKRCLTEKRSFEAILDQGLHEAN